MAGMDATELPEIVQSLDRLTHYGKRRKFEPRIVQDDTYDISCVNTDTDLESLTNRLVECKPQFSVLLYGAPGTGKSEYGRHIAKRLDKKFMFKRASDLISMWVGETEKNIAEAFRKAKEEKALLLIDEGDTFLRNREGAERSYEVSQVNEMLSQMERHPEPFILTTNLMKHLDPAAMRRFTFKMKFEFLRPDQSVKLFQRYFDCEAPRSIERMETLAPGDFRQRQAPCRHHARHRRGRAAEDARRGMRREAPEVVAHRLLIDLNGRSLSGIGRLVSELHLNKDITMPSRPNAKMHTPVRLKVGKLHTDTEIVAAGAAATVKAVCPLPSQKDSNDFLALLERIEAREAARASKQLTATR